MRRRSFLAGAATLGAIVPSLAQTGGGAMRRIGVLASNAPSVPVAAPLYADFYAGLKERGWVEGRNILRRTICGWPGGAFCGVCC
jgi:hypothetical protein